MARFVGWVGVFVGAPLSAIFILYLFAKLGGGWGLMVTNPLALILAPFPLLLIGGVGLLNRKAWQKRVNSLLFPLWSFLWITLMLIGKVFEDEILDMVILTKSNFAGILMDLGLFSNFPYFYLIIFGWIALIAVVNYCGSKE